MEGKINEVLVDQNMVNITHGPIDDSNMPGMTMNFEVTDKVDFSQLKAGQSLHFEAIKLDSGMYAVNGIHIMSEPDHSEHTMPMGETEPVPEGLSDPAWIEGKINKIMLDARMLSISHGPIEAWSMPGMTMFFNVSEDLNMSQLKEGQMIHFQAYKMAAGYMITVIHTKTTSGENDKSDDAGHAHH